MPFHAILTQFVLDIRTLLLVALVVADVFAGVLSAWRLGTFEWERLGDWLRRDVAYLLGYAVWYTLTQGALSTMEAQGVSVGDALSLFGWGTAATSLIASIGNNLKQAQQGQPL